MSITIKRKTAGFEPAVIVSTQSDLANKIMAGQHKSIWALEVTTTLNVSNDTVETFFVTGKQARSLLCLYRSKKGLTRAESLSRFFILSLTQHVFDLRYALNLEIWTERVAETRYGRYHLQTPLKIRIFSKGKQ